MTLVGLKKYAPMLDHLPVGLWIALAADRKTMVGNGPTMEDAVSAAAKKGVEDPVLVYAMRGIRGWVFAE
jgi:hypothetical protein